jgi:hypothetical protein
LATGWYIHRFALNVLYEDQFTNVVLVHHSRDGTLTWSELWAQHNENRVLFPNLVVLFLGWADHLDVVVEIWLNAILACIATALVVVTHKRRSPGIPWIFYSPVIILLASFFPLSNALFGFNLSWYLALASAAGALYVLDRTRVTGPVMALAVVLAVIASYSTLQGLLVWPAGLVLLFFRGRSVRLQAVWFLSLVATCALYLWGFDFSSISPNPGWFGTRALWFVAEIANVSGLPYLSSTSAVPGVMVVIGGAVLVVALLSMAVGLRRGQQDGAAIGAAYMTFGLLFAASAAQGRSDLGLAVAARYSVFALTLWVGTYLSLLTLRDRQLVTTGTGWRGVGRWLVASPASPYGVTRPERSSRDLVRLTDKAVRFLVIVAVLALSVQVVRSMVHGESLGVQTRVSRLQAANVAVNIDQAPDGAVVGQLGFFMSAPYLRHSVALAREDRLSLFDSPLAASEARQGLDPALLALIFEPTSGEVVKGTVLLGAAVLYRNVTGVVFQVSGVGIHASTSIRAASGYGWLAKWETGTEPDGNYRIVAHFQISGGREGVTNPVYLRVENPTAG